VVPRLRGFSGVVFVLVVESAGEFHGVDEREGVLFPASYESNLTRLDAGKYPHFDGTHGGNSDWSLGDQPKRLKQRV
jgi:hypothetical protein